MTLTCDILRMRQLVICEVAGAGVAVADVV